MWMNRNDVPKKHASFDPFESLPNDPGRHLFVRTSARRSAQAICHSETSTMRIDMEIVSHRKPGAAASVMTEFKPNPKIIHTCRRCRFQHVRQVRSANGWGIFHIERRIALCVRIEAPVQLKRRHGVNKSGHCRRPAHLIGR